MAGQSQIDALAGRSTMTPAAWNLDHASVRDIICLDPFFLDKAGLDECTIVNFGIQ